jgi:hypothetical protein
MNVAGASPRGGGIGMVSDEAAGKGSTRCGSGVVAAVVR